MSKKADVIRVWYCEKCKCYGIDFNTELLICSRCGYTMTPKTYKDVIKGEKWEKIN